MTPAGVVDTDLPTPLPSSTSRTPATASAGAGDPGAGVSAGPASPAPSTPAAAAVPVPAYVRSSPSVPSPQSRAPPALPARHGILQNAIQNVSVSLCACVGMDVSAVRVLFGASCDDAMSSGQFSKSNLKPAAERVLPPKQQCESSCHPFRVRHCLPVSLTHAVDAMQRRWAEAFSDCCACGMSWHTRVATTSLTSMYLTRCR